MGAQCARGSNCVIVTDVQAEAQGGRRACQPVKGGLRVQIWALASEAELRQYKHRLCLDSVAWGPLSSAEENSK